MCNRSLLLLPLGLLVFSTACQQAPPDTHAADVQAIRDAETAWVQAFATKDADKASSFYAADATVLLPNAPAFSNHGAIKDAMKPMLDDPNFKVTFSATRVDVAKSGDLAYTQGPYTMTMTNPATKKPIDDRGKYLTVWKKQADGSWKAVEDTFMTDRPLAAAKPAPEPKKQRKAAPRGHR